MIPYGRQDVTQADIDAVVAVLRSDFLTQGPAVPAFERAVASRVGARHAVAANSATSALHVACLALGLRRGQLLWTVPNTFVASANCARYCDADVDFVDIDPDTWNISVPALRDKLARAKRAGRPPDVVVPVDFGGQPVDQDAIWELAQDYGFRVIEDASHAIGATRRGEPIGSGRWADITIFSFHPVKIITTGEGGVAVTNDETLAERMRSYRSHGITRDASRFQVAAEHDGIWYYEQQDLGFNYRMTDIQAALGLSQLERLGSNVERRNVLAQRYRSALAGLPLYFQALRPENVSAFHLFVIRLPREQAGRAHRHVFDRIRERGIGVNLHYLPVHLQPYYRSLGFKPGYCPEAEAYGQTAITIPLFATLTAEQQDLVIDAVRTEVLSLMTSR